MREKIADYQTAKERAESCGRILRTLRFAMGIVVIIYLGLAFSLTRLRPSVAEFYVSIGTLALNTLLCGGILAVSLVLRRRGDRYARLMKEFEQADKPDPWRIGSP